MSRESVKKDCLAKCVKKECLDGWGGAGAALVDDSASHLRKQDRFECYASIQSDCLRVRGFYQVFPGASPSSDCKRDLWISCCLTRKGEIQDV